MKDYYIDRIASSDNRVLISVLIHAYAMFEIAISDICVPKKRVVKVCCAYSIADSEAGNQPI